MRAKSGKFEVTAPNHPSDTIERIKAANQVNQCIQDLNKEYD